jgi:hypothetical protein
VQAPYRLGRGATGQCSAINPRKCDSQVLKLVVTITVEETQVGPPEPEGVASTSHRVVVRTVESVTVLTSLEMLVDTDIVE